MIKAEITDIQIDQNQNIQVFTDYSDETGRVIQSGSTRYSFGVLPDMDDIKALIQKDLDAHAQILITRIHGRNMNVANLDALRKDLIGQTVEHSEGTIVTGDKVFVVDEQNIKTVSDKT